MFKLLSAARKHFRGYTILGERPYVQIGLTGLVLSGDNSKPETFITIRLWSDDNKDFILIIPDDKVESVCERLLEAKQRKAINQAAVANFNRHTS